MDKPLALDETVQALSPGQTIRPERLVSAARTEGWLAGLPRLTLQPLGPPEEAALPKPDMEVRGTLGEGGMGRVLLAWQRSLERDVAIKTLRPDAPADADARLLSEGRVTGSLEHPGIVPVHALGQAGDGAPLLVMKRIDGVSLGDLLSNPQHPMLRLLPGGREDRLQGILWVLAQVCNAVHFAHSRGIVHRDIKPDNIMVGGFGEVYLLDWGVAARLPAEGELRIRDGELAGTPVYMAPEMVSGEAGPIDARTDVYLLGATLHQALTGSPRHDGQRVIDVLHAALASVPVHYGPEVPAELAALCQQATARDRAARPESALLFRRALDTYLQHRGAEALLASAKERLAELARLCATAGPDRTAVRRTGVECRFAFELALREWPESPAAGAGKDQCLRLLCEESLSQRQPAEAGALLAEMAATPADLLGRQRALLDEVAAEEASAAELRRLAHDLDERVGARPRAYLGVVLLAFIICLSLYFGRLGLPSHGQSVVAGAVLVFLSLLAIVILRRKVMANRYSQRMAGVLFFLVSLVLLNRILGWRRGVPMPEVMIGDLLLSAAVQGAMALAVHPPIALGAALACAGAIAGTLQPARLAIIFPLTVILMMLSYLFGSLRQAK